MKNKEVEDLKREVREKITLFCKSLEDLKEELKEKKEDE